MILVTGATNFVGRAVVRRLADEQLEIRCLIQSSRHQQHLPTGVTFSIFSASLADPSALRTAMLGVTAIVHLTREEERPEERTLEDHVQGTANLVKAALEADVKRFIYVSRIGATPASAYPLFRAKGQSEIEVAESRLDYTTFRSAILYGEGDAFTTRLVMFAKMFPLLLPIPDVGMVRFQPLWVEDLARCVVEAIDREDLVERMVRLGGPEHYTLEQMIRRVLEGAGARRHLMHIPMPLMGSGSALFESLSVHNPAPRWWLDVAAAGSATELGAVPKHFGFEPCQFAHCLNYLRRRRPWRRDFIRHTLGYR
ncbi:MAG: NAD(P)H-binding protein [Anaerolineae bacterium]|jgi:NADH dehydrogenase